MTTANRGRLTEFPRWADEQARQIVRASSSLVHPARLFAFGAYHIEAITVPHGVSPDELRQAAREAFDRARQMPTLEHSWLVNIALLGEPVYQQPLPIEETFPVVTFRVTRTEQQRAPLRNHQRYVTEQQQAEERAKALLLENLDDEQRKDFAEHQFFKVKSTLTPGAYYRIYTGKTGNIHFHSSDDKFVKQLCATSSDFGVPVCDVMLVQKLMIECDEAGFLSVANDLTARPGGANVRGAWVIPQNAGGGGALATRSPHLMLRSAVLVAAVAAILTC